MPHQWCFDRTLTHILPPRQRLQPTRPVDPVGLPPAGLVFRFINGSSSSLGVKVELKIRLKGFIWRVESMHFLHSEARGCRDL